MRVIDASEYRFLSNDEILVDTNFWLLTYDVLGSRDDRGYAELLDYITSSKLYVTDLILSEFIHASVKIAFKNYCKETGHDDWNYKHDYQQTKDFNQIYKLATETVKEDILRFASILDTPKFCLESALNEPSDMLDYNDRVIVQTAINNNLAILTDDADYKDCKADIKIFTRNKSLLNYQN